MGTCRSKEHGIEQGIEKGIKQRIQQGISQGLIEGRAEGMAHSKREIAKSMKANGIPSETISKYTGLTVSEIGNL